MLDIKTPTPYNCFQEDTMTLGQKIRHLIRERKYSRIEDFYNALVNCFGPQAINRRTLTRLLKDRVIVKDRTLNQIAIILDVPTSSLREDAAAPADTLPSISTFEYNKDAVIHGLRKDLPFAPERLLLRPGGRTSREQDRTDCPESVKWFVIAKGAVTLVIEGPLGEARRTFKIDEEFAFDARQAHYFENANKRASMVYIIHYPTKNSDLFLFNR
jgi:hypothetical protein